MQTFIGFLMLAIFIFLITGLIKPSLVKVQSRKRVLLYWLGAFILLVIISPKTEKSTVVTNQSQNNQSAVQTVASVPAPTQEKIKEWRKIISLNTTSNKQSETFKLAGGQQKLIYKTSGNALCIIYIVDENKTLEKDGGFPVVTVTDTKSDETLMRKRAGNYYLDIIYSGEQCNVEIQELN